MTMQWSIRTLLNPVIVRSLIYGVNPIDMKYILQKVEKQPLVNSSAIETTWREEWGRKARRYSAYGKEAKEKGNYISAKEYYSLAAKCYYACYTVKLDQIAGKRELYKKLEGYYLQSLQCSNRRFEQVVVKLEDKKGMPGYLHLPDSKKYEAPYACVTMFAGMGSSKEEFETMAGPLVERGVAVLCLDQPGSGAALFDYDLKLSGGNLERGFEKTMEFLKNHPLIEEQRIATYGAGMGGEYAYHFAAKYPSIRCVANMFPMFITMLEEEAVPQWMKEGTWARYQVGTELDSKFLEGMKFLTEGVIKSDYLMVYSSVESLMPLDKIKEVLTKAKGRKETFLVDEESVFTMPVEEQMHWLKFKVADWFVTHLEELPKEQRR
ncbi:MAG: alpha/beta hydrolase [bacterium]|nr:alpha/beta hydrolase [bacterium]